MAIAKFDKILLDGIRSGKIPARTADARKFFRTKAKQVGDTKKVTTEQVIRGADPDRFRTTIQLGSMYLYRYQAKHRKTLPYYDAQPLIFPFRKVPGGWLGINFHYLPLPLRAKLMDALYSITNNKTFDEKTKLKLTYKTLQSATKHRWFAPTVHMYLRKQLRSKFVYIHPTEWDIMLFLPTAKFVGASKGQVFKDSIEKMRKK